MDNKIQNEKEFHDKRFSGNDPRKDTSKFYAVKKHANDYFKARISSKCKGKKLLEYGCGFGNTSPHYIQSGAILTGIDISTEGIKRAQQSAFDNNFKADYECMDAEAMTFGDDQFDLCVGSGILHHLDLNKSISEISRVLNKDGSAFFIEPMGHNPVINWYRNRTPEMRTDDEHPLLTKDIKLLKQYFKTVDVTYFALSTLAAVPFRGTQVFNSVYLAMQKLDKGLLKMPFIGKHAWTVVIEMSNPIK